MKGSDSVTSRFLPACVPEGLLGGVARAAGRAAMIVLHPCAKLYSKCFLCTTWRSARKSWLLSTPMSPARKWVLRKGTWLVHRHTTEWLSSNAKSCLLHSKACALTAEKVSVFSRRMTSEAWFSLLLLPTPVYCIFFHLHHPKTLESLVYILGFAPFFLVLR